LRNPADLALKLGVTFCIVCQHLDDERSPFVRDAVKHKPGWALRIHD
jgi:hypothetical protein